MRLTILGAISMWCRVFGDIAMWLTILSDHPNIWSRLIVGYDIRGAAQFTVVNNISCRLNVGYDTTEPSGCNGQYPSVAHNISSHPT